MAVGKSQQRVFNSGRSVMHTEVMITSLHFFFSSEMCQFQLVGVFFPSRKRTLWLDTAKPGNVQNAQTIDFSFLRHNSELSILPLCKNSLNSYFWPLEMQLLLPVFLQ
jgi:hypothetical protein